MDLQNLNVTEILHIDNVEIYEAHGEHHEEASLYTRGTLYVLYAKDYDWFILKLNDFNYGLSKNIPVLASTHEHVQRAYVLPNVQGNYVIKIMKVAKWQDLDSLENILRHNTEFAEKEGPHGKGIPIKMEDNKMIHVKLDHEPEKEETHNKAAQALYTGGKAVNKAMVNTAHAISGGISSIGSFLQTKVLKKQPDAIINPKTVQRLNTVHKATNVISSVTSPFSKGLMFISKKIGDKMDSKVKKPNGQGADIEGGNAKFTGTVGEAAMSSAVNMWHGMAESLDVIREGVTNTTSGIVTHQYGQEAGKVCKSTMGIVTNLGLPGGRLFKKA